MKTIVPILLMLSFAALAGAQTVTYNCGSQADFAKYKTYHVGATPCFYGSRRSDQGAVERVIERRPSDKGAHPENRLDPDLVLAYPLASRREKQLTSFSTGYDYGPGRRRGWYGGMGGGTTTATTAIITIGSLDVDMYEFAKKRLAWRGVVTKVIDPNAKPANRQKHLEKVAKKLFRNYPPPRSKGALCRE